MGKIKLTQILLFIAVIVILYLIVFDKDPKLNIELENKAKILEKEIKTLDSTLYLMKNDIKKYKEINEKLERKDSLSSVEINKIKKKNNIIQNKLNNATKERERAEKRLIEFKENNDQISDPAILIIDTKQKINNH